MKLIRSASRMAAAARRFHQQDCCVGVVPTMGALHEGHLSLIRYAAAHNDVVIVTIFVNPLQFGPREDFARYPRPLARDLRLARQAGADVIFLPSVQEIYPRGFETVVDVGTLAQRWEGRLRPGHFRGVATVVTILFQLTQPTNAYVGQKDYQQALIIQRLARDLHLPLRVHIRPTVREANGVAMSSRNAYLTAAQRRQASGVFRALAAGRARIRAGERRAAPVARHMRRLLEVGLPRARIEYLAIVDAKTLIPSSRLTGRVALLAAVRLGRARLIDNLLVDVP